MCCRIRRCSDDTSKSDFLREGLPRDHSRDRLRRFVEIHTRRIFVRPAAGRRWRDTGVRGQLADLLPSANAARTAGR